MVRVAIPGGIWGDGALSTNGPLRELALRAVNGEDEAFLLDIADLAAPSERATALLTRCLGDAEPETTARSLTVGDREALLLHLRRLTLGETLDCVLRCPVESCRERMELELRVDALLVPPYADVRREYEMAVDAEGARYELSFRLPTAADLDQVAPIARGDPQRGADALLEKCLRKATRNGAEVDGYELTSRVRTALAAAMAEHDPQAEIELELTCPSCGNVFSIVFDTAMFLLQELDERASQLMREVHTLAWHYHWSERDILQMPRRRRARYLDLVGDALAQSSAR